MGAMWVVFVHFDVLTIVKVSNGQASRADLWVVRERLDDQGFPQLTASAIYLASGWEEHSRFSIVDLPVLVPRDFPLAFWNSG